MNALWTMRSLPLSLALAGLMTTCASGGAVHVIDGVGIAGEVEFEVLPWALGQRGQVVARGVEGSRLELPAGTYGLRIAGTDFRHGPIRVLDEENRRIVLSGVTIRGPKQADSCVFFLLDKASGDVAARIPVNQPVSVLPGEFELIRDLADMAESKRIAPGEHLELACGAVEFAAIDAGEDMPYHIVAQRDRGAMIAAFARVSQGPQIVLPGEYRAVRQHSARFSEPIQVVAGRIARVPHGTIRLLTLGAREPLEFQVIDHAIGRALLTTRTGERRLRLIPGKYSLAQPGKPPALTIDVAAGGAQSIWMTPAGRMIAGADAHLMQLDHPPGSYVPVDESHGIRIEVAEACDAQLTAMDVSTDKPLAKLARLTLTPGVNQTAVTLPADVPDETGFYVTGQLAASSGLVLTLRSPPYIAVHRRVGRVESLSAAAVSATSVRLRWKKAVSAELAGYNVYRSLGERPLQFQQPDETEFVDVGLSAGREYEYEVAAVDSRGVEGPRAAVAAKTSR